MSDYKKQQLINNLLSTLTPTFLQYGEVTSYDVDIVEKRIADLKKNSEDSRSGSDKSSDGSDSGSDDRKNSNIVTKKSDKQFLTLYNSLNLLCGVLVTGAAIAINKKKNQESGEQDETSDQNNPESGQKNKTSDEVNPESDQKNKTSDEEKQESGEEKQESDQKKQESDQNDNLKPGQKKLETENEESKQLVTFQGNRLKVSKEFVNFNFNSDPLYNQIAKGKISSVSGIMTSLGFYNPATKTNNPYFHDYEQTDYQFIKPIFDKCFDVFNVRTLYNPREFTKLENLCDAFSAEVKGNLESMHRSKNPAIEDTTAIENDNLSSTAIAKTIPLNTKVIKEKSQIINNAYDEFHNIMCSPSPLLGNTSVENQNTTVNLFGELKRTTCNYDSTTFKNKMHSGAKQIATHMYQRYEVFWTYVQTNFINMTPDSITDVKEKQYETFDDFLQKNLDTDPWSGKSKKQGQVKQDQVNFIPNSKDSLFTGFVKIFYGLNILSGLANNNFLGPNLRDQIKMDTPLQLQLQSNFPSNASLIGSGNKKQRKKISRKQKKEQKEKKSRKRNKPNKFSV